MLKLALGSKAKIMNSGYESEMYNYYLKGWNKACFKSCAEHNGARQEVIWMNYRKDMQMSIDDFMEAGQ